jgi:hypothetical protein
MQHQIPPIKITVINMLSRKPSLEKEQESSAIKEVETLQ